jgi:hypothetical protein
MAGPNYVLSKGWPAGGAITKYRFVELATTGVTVTQTNGAGDPCIGVAQEEISAADATAGRVVNVAVMGISRCIAGAILANAGIQVGSNASGQVITAASGSVLGILLTPATATGQHVDVLLTQAGTL